MQGQEALDLKTAQAVDEAKFAEDDLIKLTSGVVLRGKAAPPLLLIKVLAAFPRPKPPTWMHPTMAREMENPDDPEYLEALQAWKMESSNATVNALIILGTELVSKPKDLPGPDDKQWLEDYAELGLPMKPESATWRYLTWVTFKAAPTSHDLEYIQEVVGRLSGVPEKKVAAADSFPGSDKEKQG